jgi:hypothetical protein
MTIDPRLYEKYTGKRPGDAMNKLGAALAQNAARKSQRETEKDVIRQTRMFSYMGAGWVVWLRRLILRY